MRRKILYKHLRTIVNDVTLVLCLGQLHVIFFLIVIPEIAPQNNVLTVKSFVFVLFNTPIVKNVCFAPIVILNRFIGNILHSNASILSKFNHFHSFNVRRCMLELKEQDLEAAEYFKATGYNTELAKLGLASELVAKMTG